MFNLDKTQYKTPLLPHGLLFPIRKQGIFYMHHDTDRIAPTMAFATPVMEQWLEQETAQCVHHVGSIRQPITSRADTLPQSYISSCIGYITSC